MASKRLSSAKKWNFFFQCDTFNFAVYFIGYLAVYEERTINWHCRSRHSCQVKNIFDRIVYYGTSEFFFSIKYLMQYILH